MRANVIQGYSPDVDSIPLPTVRGDQSIGWSMGWKVSFWARLHDGEHAFKLLVDLLKPCMQKGVNMSNGGGEVSASWTDGVLQIVTLKAKTDHSFRLKLPENMQGDLSAKLNNTSVNIVSTDGMVTIDMKKGDIFQLQ
ncbi:MAG: hypothetical protein LBV74_23200 [Tannerella sp.]|jgi:hypothetical protein|nr:hypothetical protein [Tannerella sp.]